MVNIKFRPPGAPPLAYHRDSPYFMFHPSSVATVWIALDTMTEDMGPLTYICSSHKWGREGNSSVGHTNGRSTQHFFEEEQEGKSSRVQTAAERAGRLPAELEYVSLAGLEAGGCSIHDGRTWHGSGGNVAADPHRPRRGIGIHFVPVRQYIIIDSFFSAEHSYCSCNCNCNCNCNYNYSYSVV